MGKEKFKVYNGVFDERTLNILEEFKRKKIYDELGQKLKIGKEAECYILKSLKSFKVAKIYRLINSNFKKIIEYIKNDFRFLDVKNNLRKAILFWVQKEFRNLKISKLNKVNVPTPIKVKENVLIMEYVNGDMLKNTSLENPRIFLRKLKVELKKLLLKARIIHGDLSEFNVLVEKQKPVLIDFGQAVRFNKKEDFQKHLKLLERDLKNIENYFKKVYNLNFEKEKFLNKIKEELFK